VPETLVGTIVLQPSRMRRRWLAGACGAALLVGLLLCAGLVLRPSPARIASVLAALLAAWLLGRAAGRGDAFGTNVAGAEPQTRPSIAVDQDGRFLIALDAEVRVFEPRWLNRWILLLGSGAAGRAIEVWRDSVDPATWRRLNALARWHSAGRDAAG
jgi:hypothetical protein